LVLTPSTPAVSHEVKKKVEVLLFVHDHPLSIRDFCHIIGEDTDKAQVELAIEALGRELNLADKPYGLEPVAGGWQLLTRTEYAPMLKKLVEIHKKETLSKAQLETLAVIAYNQPVTRFDIESIRGVGCSPVLKTLQERDYVRITGRADKLGAPVLYGTTKQFLDTFGLGDIQELPERDDIISTFKEKLNRAEPQPSDKNEKEDAKEN
jgi:segregation and condensation protein B